MNHFHFDIVGDTTPDKVEKLISCYLGNLPVNNNTEHYNPRVYPYMTGEQHFIRAYNSSNIVNINLKYRTIIPYSVHTVTVINALNSILTIRLRNKIREDKSGTYGIGVNCKLIREMNNTVVCDISFSADPARKDELIKAVRQTISDFATKGPSLEEITEMKKVFNVEFKQMKQVNEYWLTIMQLSSKYDTPLKTYLTIDKEVNSITPKDVQELAKKIFAGDLLIAENIPTKMKAKSLKK